MVKALRFGMNVIAFRVQQSGTGICTSDFIEGKFCIPQAMSIKYNTLRAIGGSRVTCIYSFNNNRLMIKTCIQQTAITPD